MTTLTIQNEPLKFNIPYLTASSWNPQVVIELYSTFLSVTERSLYVGRINHVHRRSIKALINREMKRTPSLTLKDIYIYSRVLGSKECFDFRKVLRICKSVRNLELTFDSKWEEACLKSLENSSKKTRKRIVELDFSHNKAFGVILTLIEKISTLFPNVVALNLNCQVQLKSNDIKEIGKLKKIKELQLDGCAMHDIADRPGHIVNPVQFLLSQLKELKTLNISNYTDSDKGFVNLSGISKLEKILLKNSPYLTPLSLQPLSLLPHLNYLNLDTQIEDETLALLSSSKHLIELHIRAIKSTTIQIISQFSQLQTLGLHDNNNDVAGDNYLDFHPLQNLTRMKKLIINVDRQFNTAYLPVSLECLYLRPEMFTHISLSPKNPTLQFFEYS